MFRRMLASETIEPLVDLCFRKYPNGLERHIKDAFPTFQGRTRTKVHVIRFEDDFARHEACIVHGA